MRLKEVNINSLIVIYLVVAKFKELSFCFSGYLVAKGPVIHRLMGDRLVKLVTGYQCRTVTLTGRLSDLYSTQRHSHLKVALQTPVSIGYFPIRPSENSVP
jgi:hypothetical protein